MVGHLAAKNGDVFGLDRLAFAPDQELGLFPHRVGLRAILHLLQRRLAYIRDPFFGCLIGQCNRRSRPP
jgi:hypothetical protein